MRPCHIRITLSSYMRAPQMPILLDSVLHELLLMRADGRGEQEEDAAQATARLSQIVARDSDDPQHVFQASTIRLIGPVLREREDLIRRTDCTDIADAVARGTLRRGARRIVLGFGRDRNGLYRYGLVWPKLLTADCVADPDALRDLLGDLHFIGGGRRLGHGAVRSLEISDGEPDAWRDRVYSEDGAGRVKTVARCLPPYYRRDARSVVYFAQTALASGVV